MIKWWNEVFGGVGHDQAKPIELTQGGSNSGR
jgi:hypothetical protein